MCGSGTTLVEASLLGIRSIGIDQNPFVCFMASAKLAGLTLSSGSFPRILAASDQVFEYFNGAKPNREQGGLVFATKAVRQKALRDELETDRGLRRLLGLAYLDAVGYAARRVNKTPRDLFGVVLGRYLGAVKSLGESSAALKLRPAAGKVIHEDVRVAKLAPESVEAVVFSPPYSFALDYIENDRPQIEYLGYEVEQLKAATVGVRGGEGSNESARILARVERYFEDMDIVMQQSPQCSSQDAAASSSSARIRARAAGSGSRSASSRRPSATASRSSSTSCVRSRGSEIRSRTSISSSS